MYRPTLSKPRRAAGIMAGLFASLLSSCQPAASPRATTTAPTSSTAPAPVAGGFKVAVVRLNDPLRIPEPSDADIKDGLKFGGVTEGKNLTYQTLDAKGSLAAVPGLVDQAVKDGANLVIALQPESAKAAADRLAEAKVPLVFAITGDPYAVGLGKSPDEHTAHVTGVFLPFRQNLIAKLVRASLPGGKPQETTSRPDGATGKPVRASLPGGKPEEKRIGIPFNPDDPESVANKDTIVREQEPVGPIVFAEFHSESEAVTAAKSLLDQKVDAIVLTVGLGGAAHAVIAEAQKRKVPVFGLTTDHAEAGAAVARVPVSRWSGFEAGRRAARILQGESPKDIPFAEGSQYKTVLNSKTTKDLGVKIPSGMMLYVTYVGGDPNSTPPAAQGLTKASAGGGTAKKKAQ